MRRRHHLVGQHYRIIIRNTCWSVQRQIYHPILPLPIEIWLPSWVYLTEWVQIGIIHFNYSLQSLKTSLKSFIISPNSSGEYILRNTPWQNNTRLQWVRNYRTLPRGCISYHPAVLYYTTHPCLGIIRDHILGRWCTQYKTCDAYLGIPYPSY